MHSALAVEIADRLLHVAVGELLHGFFQSRVFLAHDFVQLRRLHSGFLKLLERSACFHSLMLARVTHENTRSCSRSLCMNSLTCRVLAKLDSSTM